MEHYYVITGNEFGANLASKRNFKKEQFAEASVYYLDIEEDDFYAALIHVNENGKEDIILHKINDE